METNSAILKFVDELADLSVEAWREACEPYNQEIDDINAQDTINTIDILRIVDIKDHIDDIVYNKTHLIGHSHIRITQDRDKVTGIELEPPCYGDYVFGSFGGQYGIK